MARDHNGKLLFIVLPNYINDRLIMLHLGELFIKGKKISSVKINL